jgi:hypothetical protein
MAESDSKISLRIPKDQESSIRETTAPNSAESEEKYPVLMAKLLIHVPKLSQISSPAPAIPGLITFTVTIYI